MSALQKLGICLFDGMNGFIIITRYSKHKVLQEMVQGLDFHDIDLLEK